MATTMLPQNNIIAEESLGYNTVVPGATLVTLAPGTLTMTKASTSVQIFSGATTGQIVKLPDVTTLIQDPSAAVPVATPFWYYEFVNDGTASFAVQDSTAGALVTVNPGQRLKARNTIATTNGAWTWQLDNKSSLKTKSGIVASGSFAGTPKIATVTFTTAYPDANYSVTVTGADARTWSVPVATRLAGSFVINANANQALTGAVTWQAIYQGET